MILAAVAYPIGVIMQTVAPPPAAFSVGGIFLGAALGIISVVVSLAHWEAVTVAKKVAKIE